MYKEVDGIKFYSFKEFKESEIYILEDWAMWADGISDNERETNLVNGWNNIEWTKEESK